MNERTSVAVVTRSIWGNVLFAVGFDEGVFLFFYRRFLRFEYSAVHETVFNVPIFYRVFRRHRRRVAHRRRVVHRAATFYLSPS